MTGRLAAVSHHTVAGAVREHFGFTFHAGPLVVEVVLDLLLLAAEIGGVSIALQLATGIALRRWVIPVAFAALRERLAATVRFRSRGYRVRWDQLDLADPDAPRLRCTVHELAPLR